MADVPCQSAQSRVLGVAELLEAILLAFAEHQPEQAEQEPALQLYPLLRVCKTWNRAITSSPSLQFLMLEPRPLKPRLHDSIWKDSTTSLSSLLYGMGDKLGTAWKKARDSGISEGSWTQIRVVGSEAKDAVQLTWYSDGVDKMLKLKPGTTFGEFFDKMNRASMFWDRKI